ncbi:MAG: MmcQ/YjbR family DNA-binding protein [Rhodopseudomonas sp.]|uniref:MmcQ/YjbR family DNA-binding protein n=1 Tax=Rhodopseudomonas sp. TaxID=1078 RepID=UPI0039E5D058
MILGLIIEPTERAPKMSTSHDLRRIALSLQGTIEAPHFDRIAFKARRIYVTLASDGRTANFKFTPEQQEFKCLTHPAAFSPVPNGWGKRGATTAILAKLSLTELEDALRLAWTAAAAKPSR